MLQTIRERFMHSVKERNSDAHFDEGEAKELEKALVSSLWDAMAVPMLVSGKSTAAPTNDENSDPNNSSEASSSSEPPPLDRWLHASSEKWGRALAHAVVPVIAGGGDENARKRQRLNDGKPLCSMGPPALAPSAIWAQRNNSSTSSSGAVAPGEPQQDASIPPQQGGGAASRVERASNRPKFVPRRRAAEQAAGSAQQPHSGASGEPPVGQPHSQQHAGASGSGTMGGGFDVRAGGSNIANSRGGMGAAAASSPHVGGHHGDPFPGGSPASEDALMTSRNSSDDDFGPMDSGPRPGGSLNIDVMMSSRNGASASSGSDSNGSGTFGLPGSSGSGGESPYGGGDRLGSSSGLGGSYASSGGAPNRSHGTSHPASSVGGSFRHSDSQSGTGPSFHSDHPSGLHSSPSPAQHMTGASLSGLPPGGRRAVANGARWWSRRRAWRARSSLRDSRW